MNVKQERVVIAPDDGARVSLGGIGVIYKLSGDDTGGAFSIVEHPIEPGRLVPPHVHARDDEFSYVIEGEIGVMVGGQEYLVSPGSYVVKPHGLPHAYWNAGTKAGRLLEIISPAGFEKFFQEAARLFSQGNQLDRAQLKQLADRYGDTHLPELAPPLMTKYNLRLIGQ